MVEADRTDNTGGMDLAFTLSTALGVVGLTGQLVASRNPIVGWTISIAAQPLWYAFYITVGGWGLIPLSTGYLIAAVLHLRKALRGRGVRLRGYPAWVCRCALDRLRRRQQEVPEPAA